MSSVDGLVEPGLHPGLVALPLQLGHDADLQPLDVAELAPGCRDDRRNRRVDRRRVPWVMAGDDLVQQSGVEHRPGERAALVE